TTPPASSTISDPAATSHGASDSSQKPSNQPDATWHRSSAAEPARRTPDDARSTASSWRVYSGNRCSALNGNPVPINPRERVSIPDTEARSPPRNAPPPRAAVHSSPVALFSTTPACITPSRATPIDTAYT